MGNFFTSIQIHNPEQLSKEHFIELFCNKMRENGFVIGSLDDHKISYALSFADDCKWVALGSEVYEQGNATVQKDARNIAKMLNACCINVTVVDSDFAMLDMYSNKGKKLDTVVMGRADDYLSDEISMPKKNVWSAILNENSTWERFTAVQQGDYIFVEDGLAELALLLGMDSRNILFDVEDANESDENTCFLYFKKASIKKTKKITLNAAFKQVFGEALGPLGFVKIKSKHPYYVRVVNGEILHIITYRTEQAQYPEDKAFSILGGIATVYRRKIDLNIGIQRNYNWLRNSISTFYILSNKENYDKNYCSKISSFNYFSTIEASLINAMNESKILTEKHILPVFNEVNTLEKCIDFFHKYKLPFSTCDYRKNIDFNNCDQDDEGFLYIQTDFEKKKNRLKEILSDPNIDDVKRKRTEEIYSFFIETDVRNAALAELDRRKQSNVEILKSYGLNMESPQKPKKLTLNVAFKQVFGEALEPLGFVKIKSKHPYYVRVVNGEILHIITYRTEQAQYPEDKAFNVLGGVATVYRRKIDLSVGIKNNYNWLRSSVDDFYAISFGDDHDRYYRQTISSFYYFSEIEKSMLSALNDSLELVKKYMLPVLNNIDTLEKSIEFFEKFTLLIDTSAYNADLCFVGDSDYNEGFLYIKTDYTELKEKWRRIIENEKKVTPEKLKRVTELYKFFVDPVFNKAVLDELDRRKQSNVEILKSYGLNMESPQKPKKLTLNVAFKQVFGEALEPLGFKKVKSKYPYYARLVNDEILQVITVVSRPDKRFEILGGIATVYRQSLSLDLNPKMNESWLIGNFYYYGNIEISDNERKYSLNEIYEFYCDDWLEKEMKRALNATTNIMLDIFDKVDSLEKCIGFYNFFGMDIRVHHKEDFGNSYPINYYNEGLMVIKTMNLEQYSSLMNKYKEITINRRKEQMTNGGISYEKLMNEQEFFKNKKISEYKDSLDDKEWLATVNIELNNRRNHNIKLLEEYGLI